MIALTHFRLDAESSESFIGRAEAALEALANRPGYLRGTVARSLDDPAAWTLLTEWESVGAYRRALGNFEVRLHATALMAGALDLPSAFEPLVDIGPGGDRRSHRSDRCDEG